jgi:hypothetical protein
VLTALSTATADVTVGDVRLRGAELAGAVGACAARIAGKRQKSLMR